jgi:hypothetical protein
MYKSLSRVLRPNATVFIISWRQPEGGLDWLVDTVLPALVAGNASPGCARDRSSHFHRAPRHARAQLGQAIGPCRTRQR